MEEWFKILVLLCTFGLVREIRPSEPYVSEFLLGEWRNITEEDLNKYVYPVGTYSYMSLLVLVFLITDYLKYKPLIILSGLCGIAVYAILLWTESFQWLQVSQFFYGLYMATEVAYYTYMFAKVDGDKYEKVASWSRASALVGRFISGLLAQLLVSFSLLNLRELNYITFSSQILCTLWALLLPSVKKSVYFHRKFPESKENHEKENSQENPVKPPTTDINQLYGIKLLWEHMRSSYKKPEVIGWSLCYAASSAGFFQVQSYMQLLWKDINPNTENLYNGSVEAILTVLGACGAVLAGYRFSWCGKQVLLLLPAIIFSCQAAASFVTAYATVIWVSYISYIILGIAFHYIITVVSAEIAKNLIYESCFGLVFGINTFAGLIIQSLLIVIVISDAGFGLDIREQYIAWAVYYSLLAIISFVSWVTCNLISHFKSRNGSDIVT